MAFNSVREGIRGYFRNNAKLPETIVYISLFYFLIVLIRRFFRPTYTTLSGPPSTSRIFGLSEVLQPGYSADILEQWAEKYGPVFRVPLALGSSRVVLCDPKAAGYFYSQETTGILMNKNSKIISEQLFGRGLMWSEGESHRRQRRNLAPAFSNKAIEALSTVFFDSAYKLKVSWDSILDSTAGGETLIDVQAGMNKISLDTIGIAGFSHDFGTLHGKHSTVAEVIDSFTQKSKKEPSYSALFLNALIPLLPILAKLPTRRGLTIKRLNNTLMRISKELLARTRRENDVGRGGNGKGPESIVETLILAEGANEPGLSDEEVLAQMKLYILAGYETTSVSLTWALIELCLNPSIQDTLRAELSTLSTDPTYEQLTNSLPYLDAVAKETFRFHPPVSETIRQAAVDHVIPLGTPLTTPQGKVVDRIHIAAGTNISSPIRLLNRSRTIWGEDAHDFVPARWTASEAGPPDWAKEIPGYSHLFTFSNGPRTCLGRQFAITVFKAVLATLIRHYEFRLNDGADTKFENVQGLLPRPRIVGDEGCRMPMLVKRVD